MANLQRAIQDYIKYENEINSSSTTRSALEAQYKEKLSYSHSGFCEVPQAEEIYLAYEAIFKHNNNLQKCQELKDKSQEVIANYLKALGGNKLSYRHTLNDGRATTLTYSFYLEGDKVCHNHQKNT